MRRTPHLALVFLSALLGLALLHACGGVGVEGTIVGGPCTTSEDCSSGSRCLTSGDFPGGTCTQNCSEHLDCPEGARCISKESGICLLECELPADCRGGYTCKGKSNETGGGESLVCIKD